MTWYVVVRDEKDYPPEHKKHGYPLLIYADSRIANEVAKANKMRVVKVRPGAGENDSDHIMNANDELRAVVRGPGWKLISADYDGKKTYRGPQGSTIELLPPSVCEEKEVL